MRSRCGRSARSAFQEAMIFARAMRENDGFEAISSGDNISLGLAATSCFPVRISARRHRREKKFPRYGLHGRRTARSTSSALCRLLFRRRGSFTIAACPAYERETLALNAASA